MKLKDQVVSLGLAKDMQKLGCPQDSLWYWTYHHTCEHPESEDDFKWGIFQKDEDDVVNEHISAHTVAEMGEMLPPDTDSGKTSNNGYVCYMMDSDGGDTYWYKKCEELKIEFEPQVFYAKKHADAMSKMWIYLKKEGLL